MQVTLDPGSFRLLIVCVLALLVCNYVYPIARFGNWDEIRARLKALGLELTWHLKRKRNPPKN